MEYQTDYINITHMKLRQNAQKLAYSINLCISINHAHILLTRLRAGCLDIEIEVGRWRGVPHNQRICRICNDEIETEMHFLFYCTNLHHVRILFNTFFIDLYKCNSDLERFAMLFAKQYITLTARFIRNLYDERKRILYKKIL